MSTKARTVLVMLVVALVVINIPPALAHHTPIQPGAQLRTTSGSCTLNFVFDGIGPLDGRVFIGTAAHCVKNVGQTTNLAGHANAGNVFYLGDVPNTINGDGRSDNGIPGHQLDFALIEITGSPHQVVAEVKGHSGDPSGETRYTETSIGDQVFLSGYGMGFSSTAPTREMRSGILASDNTRTYSAYAPGAPGDSGGPVLHESGKAIGVVSTLGANGIAGPTVEGVLNELDALDLPVEVRTA